MHRLIDAMRSGLSAALQTETDIIRKNVRTIANRIFGNVVFLMVWIGMTNGWQYLVIGCEVIISLCRIIVKPGADRDLTKDQFYRFIQLAD